MTGAESDSGGGHSPMTAMDALLFVYATLAAVWLAYLVLAESLQLNYQIALLLVFWLLVAYLVLPRLHRVLTYIYVPNYFIGRTRTSDGLLGDPVNLSFRGDEAQVHAAMTAAGWTPADEVTLASSLRIVRATLTRRPYPEAPVSPLHLFERRQDFAYQQDVHGNPAQRHHVRFWRCPPGWRLPGGALVDWLAAGTYDRSVGLSLMTLQVTHRIARHIDRERDHIVTTVLEANPRAGLARIPHFASGYHARNGGGDQMVTDGDLPVVDLRRVETAGTGTPARVRDTGHGRPAPTVFSACAAWLRAALALALAVAFLVRSDGSTALTGTSATAAATASALTLAVVAALDLVLGTATYRGRNWARVLLMLSSAVAIAVAFAVTAAGGPRPTLGSSLPHVALGILMLLALTSPAARAYATRRSGRARGGGLPSVS